MRTVLLIGVAALCAGGVVLVFLRSEPAPPPPPPPAVVAAPVQPAPPAPAAPPDWFRPEPGVRYAPARSVPDVLYRKYQRFDEAGVLDAAGATDGYQVTYVAAGARLGLRPGDRIISVNGQPVAAGLEASKALFERLKTERRLTVLVERDGKQETIAFEAP